jgi:hypothetical protein
MKRIFYVVTGLLVAMGGAASGCGDTDSNTGSTGDNGGGGSDEGGGGNAGGNGGDNTGGTTTNGGGAGQGGSGGGAETLSCTKYCATITSACTGDLLQFTDMPTCMSVCSSYPVGKVSDTGGQDSLGCRTYHAGFASMSAANAKTHCWHAGPTGGDGDNQDDVAGVCGDGCEAFCNLEKVACGFGTTGNNQYADNATCMTACKAFDEPAATQLYDVPDASTKDKDFFCYVYHLTAATQNPVLHCPHTKKGGGQCEMVKTPL